MSRIEAVRADLAAIDPIAMGPIEVEDGAQLISTPHPVSDMAAGAFGALAAAGAELRRLRGGAPWRPVVNRPLAGVALANNEYLTIDGEAPRSWDPLTGYYASADGRHVYLHANFPHHRDGLLDLFSADNDREALAASVARWEADEAEETAQARGLCCMKLRSRAEWEAHGQRAALGALPLIGMTSLGPGAGRRLPALSPQGRPLEGVRVLDLSRVVAGPMAGRALAELGADVLRVSAPDLPFVEALVIDTGFGKRNAYADLNEEAGRETLRALIREADVLIDGFRPGALAAKGFSAAEIAALNPDIVVADLSAFGEVGPWAGRRGYDSYIQAGVGFIEIPEGGAPVRLPCQPLDYLTGVLLAFGAVAALARRAASGGAWRVEMSLARTAMWFWEMSDRLGPDGEAPAGNIDIAGAGARGWLREMDCAWGRASSLAPPYGYREDALVWSSAPARLGSHEPVWAAG